MSQNHQNIPWSCTCILTAINEQVMCHLWRYAYWPADMKTLPCPCMTEIHPLIVRLLHQLMDGAWVLASFSARYSTQ